MSSRIFNFTRYPQVLFLRRSNSSSNVSPVLSPTNVAASPDTAPCAAPVSLSVWVLPPRAPLTLLTASRCLCPSWWGGGVGFFYLAPPHAPPTPLPRCLCMYLWCVCVCGGGGVDTWSPSRTPNFAVYVCPGGDWIHMVMRPFLDYVDNLSLVLVIEE